MVTRWSYTLEFMLGNCLALYPCRVPEVIFVSRRAIFRIVFQPVVIRNRHNGNDDVGTRFEIPFWVIFRLFSYRAIYCWRAPPRTDTLPARSNV